MMLKKKLGLSISFILIIFPIYLWTLRMPLSMRFFDFNTITTSFGQLTGILGMAMLTIVIILSSRLKFLEKYFGGLDKVYFLHHFLGGLSLVFLLFHPVVLVLKFVKISLHTAALFFLPVNSGAVDFGIFALFFLILLLVFTFFTKFSYRTWKITHKFLGLAFFFAILHIFVVPSDISLFLPLTIYMGFLVLLGLSAFFYRTLFGKYLIKKLIYKVDEVNKLNDKVIEIVMSTKGERLKYQAGQYIFISFRNGGVSKDIHPFSITSGIFDSKLRITVKSFGKYTTRLRNLKIGAEAIIEGPFGVFSYLKNQNKNQVWIAGGVGITPFLSMLRSLKEKDYKIDLYYCVGTQSEIVFYEELKKISFENNNFRIIPVCGDVHGRIDIKTIKSISGNILEKDFFLCGPPLMMKGVRSLLLENNVRNENIHSEEFSF